MVGLSNSYLLIGDDVSDGDVEYDVRLVDEERHSIGSSGLAMQNIHWNLHQNLHVDGSRSLISLSTRQQTMLASRDADVL